MSLRVFFVQVMALIGNTLRNGAGARLSWEFRPRFSSTAPF